MNMSGFVIKVFSALLLISVKVDSMALTGPSLLRYDPCAQGILHFDRLDETSWQAVVNIGLYSKLGENDVSVDVNFENPVQVYDVSHNCTVKVMENNHRYIFEPLDSKLVRYFFYVRLENNITDIPSVKKFTFNNETLCDDDIKATQHIQSLNVTTKSENYSHVCGRRSLPNAELTTMRSEVHPGDWPWHVAIFIRDVDSSSTSYMCGGSVISRTAVLTAGHCVSSKGVLTPASRIVVVAGTNNYTDRAQPGRQTFIANEVVLHPNYDDDEATADLAVIRVSQFRYTEYVQPVCIWGPVYDKTNLFGYQATIVGFGATENNVQSNILRAAYTLVQNDSTCIDYDSDLYGPLLNEFTFCAGFGPDSTINPRNGDSGGGLVVPMTQPDNKISWLLRGVLSKCGLGPNQTSCNPSYYVIYTDVGPHYGWIVHHSGLVFTNNIISDRLVVNM